MAPKREDAERTCLVTRAAQPPEGLIRFVLDPQGRVVPDIRGRLPGRGVWVGARRDLVETAVRKRLFGRGFRREAPADPALPDLVERLLEDAALGALGMARKAGLVVTGFGKVQSALSAGEAVALVHAAEAAADGRRKLAQAMRRAQRSDEAPDDEGGYDREGAAARRIYSGPTVIDGLFGSGQLDLALGGSNVIHAALLAGGASNGFLIRAGALARYRGQTFASAGTAVPGTASTEHRPGGADPHDDGPQD